MDDREMKELLELSRENNRLLHKMRRSAFIGNILRIIWYSVLIGGPIFIYYYLIQPYIGVLLETYGSGVEDIQNFGNQIPGFKSLFGGGQ